jgi:UDP-3-O-[3-hydroxymyristoyl] glucosamine N-acyltransferase
VGDYVTLGGQVGLADHLKIGSFTSFASQTGVHQNIEANSGAYGGYPAVPAREWAKQSAALARLPELRKKVMQIEKKLEEDK